MESLEEKRDFGMKGQSSWIMRSSAGNVARQCVLSELPVGASATIVEVMPRSRGRKKFADVGLVPGIRLQMEAHAPFGSLIRVKVLETSMALHRDDAASIVIETGGVLN